jgi:hypothetical protein
VLAAGALGACASTPSNRTVVSEVIESLQLPQAEEECMMERLDGYTDDEIDQIADDNDDWDPAGQGDTPADASEGMQLFISDFEECTEGAAGDESTGTSEPSGSTEPSGTAGPTASTASAESTGPTGATTPPQTTEG